jgi:hypothetical protein
VRCGEGHGRALLQLRNEDVEAVGAQQIHHRLHRTEAAVGESGNAAAEQRPGLPYKRVKRQMPPDWRSGVPWWCWCAGRWATQASEGQPNKCTKQLRFRSGASVTRFDCLCLRGKASANCNRNQASRGRPTLTLPRFSMTQDGATSGTELNKLLCSSRAFSMYVLKKMPLFA